MAGDTSQAPGRETMASDCFQVMSDEKIMHTGSWPSVGRIRYQITEAPHSGWPALGNCLSLPIVGSPRDLPARWTQTSATQLAQYLALGLRAHKPNERRSIWSLSQGAPCSRTPTQLDWARQAHQNIIRVPLINCGAESSNVCSLVRSL